MPDSVTVCGIKDRGYAARLAETAGRITFRPAVVDGRAARGVAWLGFSF